MLKPELIKSIKAVANDSDRNVLYTEGDIEHILSACETVIFENLPKGKKVSLCGAIFEFVEGKASSFNGDKNASSAKKNKYRARIRPNKKLRDYSKSFTE